MTSASRTSGTETLRAGDAPSTGHHVAVRFDPIGHQRRRQSTHQPGARRRRVLRRGALQQDMKNMSAILLATLERRMMPGELPARNLVFGLFADDENGATGDHGGWSPTTSGLFADCDAAISEVGKPMTRRRTLNGRDVVKDNFGLSRDGRCARIDSQLPRDSEPRTNSTGLTVCAHRCGRGRCRDFFSARFVQLLSVYRWMYRRLAV